MKTVRLKITVMMQLPIPVPLTSQCQLRIFSCFSKTFFNWFDNNHLRTYQGKFNLSFSYKLPQVVFISATTITSSTAETLLGIIIDSELNLENNLNLICNKMSRKINSLDRIINNCMPLGKYKILMKIFIESQFSVL